MLKRVDNKNEFTKYPWLAVVTHNYDLDCAMNPDRLAAATEKINNCNEKLNDTWILLNNDVYGVFSLVNECLSSRYSEAMRLFAEYENRFIMGYFVNGGNFRILAITEPMSFLYDDQVSANFIKHSDVAAVIVNAFCDGKFNIDSSNKKISNIETEFPFSGMSEDVFLFYVDSKHKILRVPFVENIRMCTIRYRDEYNEMLANHKRWRSTVPADIFMSEFPIKAIMSDARVYDYVHGGQHYGYESIQKIVDEYIMRFDNIQYVCVYDERNIQYVDDNKNTCSFIGFRWIDINDHPLEFMKDSMCLYEKAYPVFRDESSCFSDVISKGDKEELCVRSFDRSMHWYLGVRYFDFSEGAWLFPTQNCYSADGLGLMVKVFCPTAGAFYEVSSCYCDKYVMDVVSIIFESFGHRYDSFIYDKFPYILSMFDAKRFSHNNEQSKIVIDYSESLSDESKVSNKVTSDERDKVVTKKVNDESKVSSKAASDGRDKVVTKKVNTEDTMQRFMESVERIRFCDIYDYFRERIIGHDDALKKACYYVWCYIKSLIYEVDDADEVVRNNFIIAGCSGCGKTEFMRVLSKYVEEHVDGDLLSVSRIDASTISESGWRGNNFEDMIFATLSKRSGNSGIGIIFLDELDKKLMPSYYNGRNISAAIQSNMLTAIEGSKDVMCRTEGLNLSVDTRRTLFIGLGTFDYIRNKHVATGKPVGFSDINMDDAFDRDYWKNVTIDDVIEQGASDEFVGRFSDIINFCPLDKKSLIRIVKSHIDHHYNHCASRQRVIHKISYSNEFLDEVAQISLKSKRGAREMIHKLDDYLSTIYMNILDNNPNCIYKFTNEEINVYINSFDDFKVSISYVDARNASYDDECYDDDDYAFYDFDDNGDDDHAFYDFDDDDDDTFYDFDDDEDGDM